jgi:hypothetical protein
MPDYCANIITIDSVPSFDDMVPFVPYFAVPNGCTYIDVFIKVPNNCYYIASDENHAPAAGACGAPGDLQNTIYLDISANCTDSTPTKLTKRLNYSEDPNGHILFIYVLDQTTGNVGGGAKTKKTMVG